MGTPRVGFQSFLIFPLKFCLLYGFARSPLPVKIRFLLKSLYSCKLSENSLTSVKCKDSLNEYIIYNTNICETNFDNNFNKKLVCQIHKIITHRLSKSIHIWEPKIRLTWERIKNRLYQTYANTS